MRWIERTVGLGEIEECVSRRGEGEDRQSGEERGEGEKE